MHQGFGFTTKLSHRAKSPSAAAADTNLASAETHYQVSNEGVFCLSRTVAHHHTPAVGLGQLAAARDQEMKLTLCPVPSRITGQGADQELLSHMLRLWKLFRAPCDIRTMRVQVYLSMPSIS